MLDRPANLIRASTMSCLSPVTVIRNVQRSAVEVHFAAPGADVGTAVNKQPDERVSRLTADHTHLLTQGSRGSGQAPPSSNASVCAVTRPMPGYASVGNDVVLAIRS
jgi:hypothetical protein